MNTKEQMAREIPVLINDLDLARRRAAERLGEALLRGDRDAERESIGTIARSTWRIDMAALAARTLYVLPFESGPAVDALAASYGEDAADAWWKAEESRRDPHGALCRWVDEELTKTILGNEFVRGSVATGAVHAEIARALFGGGPRRPVRLARCMAICPDDLADAGKRCGLEANHSSPPHHTGRNGWLGCGAPVPDAVRPARRLPRDAEWPRRCTRVHSHEGDHEAATPGGEVVIFRWPAAVKPGQRYLHPTSRHRAFVVLERGAVLTLLRGPKAEKEGTVSDSPEFQGRWLSEHGYRHDGMWTDSPNDEVWDRR